MKLAMTGSSSNTAFEASPAAKGDVMLSLIVPRAPAHLRRLPWPTQTGLSVDVHGSKAIHAPTLPPRANPPRRRGGTRRSDARPAIRLDQYYTRPRFAERCYRILCQYYDPAEFLMVEPSAGKGVFARMLPAGSLAYDVEPKHPLVQRANFFDVEIPTDRPVIVIGNPPFGRGCRMAVRFFNRAARSANVIAMVLPRSARKARIQNRLNRTFHLVREELAPAKAFEFEGRHHDVPAVFQIWERRDVERTPRIVETSHPDFEFVKPAFADFAIRRIGVRAGRIHRDLNCSESSHYFIRGDVEAVMRKLALAQAAADTAAVPSLAKSEIVELYRRYVEGGDAQFLPAADGSPTGSEPM